ncbi:MAG: hypothetical protein OXE99_12365 [Cellvibrionales bacterium]|nr:hypothetical protein [Cellvibrionales bacterium]
MLTLQQILMLKKNDVTTMSQLALLLAADSPKPFQALAKETGVTVRGIERMIERGTDLLKVVEAKKNKKQENTVGRPVVRAVVRTPKATRLLKKLA